MAFLPFRVQFLIPCNLKNLGPFLLERVKNPIPNFPGHPPHDEAAADVLQELRGHNESIRNDPGPTLGCQQHHPSIQFP